MRIHRLLVAALLMSSSLDASLPAVAGPSHRRLARSGYVHYATRVRYGRFPAYGTPPLAGTVGTAIPPGVARYLGYPYNVPGYRYEYADACLLRVGGPFGPGPSAGPCPFGLDRPF